LELFRVIFVTLALMMRVDVKEDCQIHVLPSKDLLVK